jgi:hypothetical protein
MFQVMHPSSDGRVRCVGSFDGTKADVLSNKQEARPVMRARQGIMNAACSGSDAMGQREGEVLLMKDWFRQDATKGW